MTTDVGKQLERTHTLAAKVARLFQHRAQLAQSRYAERIQKTLTEQITSTAQQPVSPWEWWNDWYRYSVDFAQRSVLFWDTLRQRGNQFTEREQAGLPPVLHFAYETVLDA